MCRLYIHRREREVNKGEEVFFFFFSAALRVVVVDVMEKEFGPEGNGK